MGPKGNVIYRYERLNIKDLTQRCLSAEQTNN